MTATLNAYPIFLINPQFLQGPNHSESNEKYLAFKSNLLLLPRRLQGGRAGAISQTTNLACTEVEAYFPGGQSDGITEGQRVGGGGFVAQ